MSRERELHSALQDELSMSQTMMVSELLAIATNGRVPSLVEKQNERLRLALEMIFREVVFNLLACSKDEYATMRWAQDRVESIFCDKQDADEEASKQTGQTDG